MGERQKISDDFTSRLENNRNNLMIEERLGAVLQQSSLSSPVFESFARAFMGAMSAEKLMSISDDGLNMGLLSAFSQLNKARTEQEIIGLRPAHESGEGGPVGCTVIEVVTDDKPFLVESIIAAIQNHSREVHNLVSLVAVIQHDQQGRLSSIDLPKKAADSVSAERIAVIQAQIDPAVSPEEDEALKAALKQVFDDVYAAFEDWERMRVRMRALATEMSHAEACEASVRTEAAALLEWFEADQFTFLGWRSYEFNHEQQSLTIKPKSGLGIFRDDNRVLVGGLRHLNTLPDSARALLDNRDPLVIVKSSDRSNVHRSAPMDVVLIKRYDTSGLLKGIEAVPGLLAAAAYSDPPRRIPVLRRKVNAILERSGHSPKSHGGRTLRHLLDSFPRDELFQASEDELMAITLRLLVLGSHERREVALLTRQDPFGRFISVLLYVPRDKYRAELLRGMIALIEKKLLWSSEFNPSSYER